MLHHHPIYIDMLLQVNLQVKVQRWLLDATGPYNTICSINTAKAKCEIAKISTARHCRHATSGGRTHATYCSGTCNTTEYFRCNAGRQIKHRRRDVALVAEKSPCEDPASDLLTRAVTHLDRCQLANAKGSHQLRR